MVELNVKNVVEFEIDRHQIKKTVTQKEHIVNPTGDSNTPDLTPKLLNLLFHDPSLVHYNMYTCSTCGISVTVHVLIA